MSTLSSNTLQEVALRIREMREIFDFSIETMAQKTEVSVEEYVKYESGELDFPFTFIQKSSLETGALSDVSGVLRTVICRKKKKKSSSQ